MVSKTFYFNFLKFNMFDFTHFDGTVKGKNAVMKSVKTFKTY